MDILGRRYTLYPRHQKRAEKTKDAPPNKGNIMAPNAPSSSVPPTRPADPADSPDNDQKYLDVPIESSFRRPSLDSIYSDLSQLSIYPEELRHGRPLISEGARRLSSLSPTPRRGWRGTLRTCWIRNKGVALVLASQLFGAGMNVAARLLETDGTHGKAMHPFQASDLRGLEVWKDSERPP